LRAEQHPVGGAARQHQTQTDQKNGRHRQEQNENRFTTQMPNRKAQHQQTQRKERKKERKRLVATLASRTWSIVDSTLISAFSSSNTNQTEQHCKKHKGKKERNKVVTLASRTWSIVDSTLISAFSS
jgi:hypothetical protein